MLSSVACGTHFCSMSMLTKNQNDPRNDWNYVTPTIITCCSLDVSTVSRLDTLKFSNRTF